MLRNHENDKSERVLEETGMKNIKAYHLILKRMNHTTILKS